MNIFLNNIFKAALLYYDYALTFPMEVKFVWKAKFRVSTFLYLCCRYALIANVIYLLAIAQKLNHRVGGSLVLSDWLLILRIHTVCFGSSPLVFCRFKARITSFVFSSCDMWYKVIGASSILGRAAVISESWFAAPSATLRVSSRVDWPELCSVQSQPSRVVDLRSAWTYLHHSWYCEWSFWEQPATTAHVAWGGLAQCPWTLMSEHC